MPQISNNEFTDSLVCKAPALMKVTELTIKLP